MIFYTRVAFSLYTFSCDHACNTVNTATKLSGMKKINILQLQCYAWVYRRRRMFESNTRKNYFSLSLHFLPILGGLFGNSSLSSRNVWAQQGTALKCHESLFPLNLFYFNLTFFLSSD